MTKKIIIILLISIIAFSQPHGRASRRQDGKMQGGYHTAERTQLEQMKNGGPFPEIQLRARTFYKDSTGQTLGDIIQVQKQIVSGMNFRITFAGAPSTDPEVQNLNVIIVVFFQPWTKTIQVTNISPPIDGVTDPTGRVLATDGSTEQN